MSEIRVMMSSEPTLGLCVIAKNAEATVRECLLSARNFVSAMVLVDTGSTDATAALAAECGAHVVHFQWAGDFASARNVALKAIDTDWVLVLDADEELDAAAHAWIRAELAAPQAEAYITPVRNYLKPWDRPLTGVFPIAAHERHPRASGATDYAHSEVCRLFRRDPDVYYVGHVHEQVEYRLMQLGRPIGRAGFFIHHFGWYLIDEVAMERKRKLYHDLLAEKVEQRPDDPQTLMQYGDALCAWSGKYREGLDFLMKAAALGSKDPAIWMYIAAALLKLGQVEAALIAINQAPQDREFAGRRAQLKGEALALLKNWKEARASFEEACRLHPDSILMQAKLALVEIEDGDDLAGVGRIKEAIRRAEEQALFHREASPYLYVAELHSQIRQWPEALRMAQLGLLHDPSLLPLLQLQLRSAVAVGDLVQAADAASRIVALFPEPKTILRQAALLNQLGNQDGVRDVISRGLEQFPLSDELQRAGREIDLKLSHSGVPTEALGAPQG